jgi:hypothetical protein
VDEIPDALVVPYVTARSNEQGLARCYRVEADAALGAVHARCVWITVLANSCALEQALVCCGVEVVETLLPAAVAFYANLDTSENDLLATLEVYAKLDNISIVDGVWSALDTRTWQAHVVEESSRAGLDIFDVPLSACTPEFAVAAGNDFWLEANG